MGQAPQEKKWKMKGYFWNIRGQGKVEKKQSLIDLLAEYDVDFVGIQETKQEDFQLVC
jgi:exonuclease III